MSLRKNPILTIVGPSPGGGPSSEGVAEAAGARKHPVHETSNTVTISSSDRFVAELRSPAMIGRKVETLMRCKLSHAGEPGSEANY